MARTLLVLFVALLATWSAVSADATVPKVTIKQGSLRGKILKTISDKDIYSFFGIPYAKPPRRFMPAEPAVKWKGEWDATHNRSVCAQLRYPDLLFVGEEDCLFANVYTTKLPDPAKKSPLAPVIVYIHGGIFVHSSGDHENYDPCILLDGEEGSLVFVTFNYRLGVIGFLSTEDSASPGNYGLKDQVVLLKWVRDNIAAFGGDPHRVTLMGDNAGGVSAHMHMLSPLSTGLFQAAISQSGTALTHWAINRDPLGRTHRLAELLECGDNKTLSFDIVKCLRDVDVVQLVKKSHVVLTWRHDWIVPFLPSIEEDTWSNGNAFLTDYPRHLMQEGNFESVPWLASVCSHDGLPHSLQLMLFSNIMKDLNDDFEKYAPYYFELDGPMDVAVQAAKKIRSFYLEGHAMSQGNQVVLANMHTDYYYFLPLIRSAAMHVTHEADPMYIYHFSYQYRKSRLATGVPQGDDTHYMLPTEKRGRIPPVEGSLEMKIAKRLVSIVRNFATIGKPIADDDTSLGVSWPPVDEDAMNFIDFNKALTLNTTFYPERMKFWDEIEELLYSGFEDSVKDEL